MSAPIHDPPQSPPSVPATDRADEDADDPYSALRALLLAPEHEELAALRQRLAQPVATSPDSVAAVLPAAITLAQQGDSAVATALLPIVEQSIAQSVKQHPEVITDAIFPIIGSAISRAVREALLRMMQQTTYAMENAFSLRSWRWRLEARTTGKPFSEVVLLHSLVYRVEQVFLIQPESGLLLQHVVADSVAAAQPEGAGDASMVSSMLTAIQAFVRDSFRVDSKAALDSIEVGELTVWIERGPQAVLAVVLRGTAPLSLRPLLREALAHCHRDCGAQIKSWGGDMEELRAARPYLEACLQTQLQPPARRPVAVWIALSVACLVGLFFAGQRLLREHAAATRFAQAVALLRAQPGVVIVHAARAGGRAEIVALRDADARSESDLLQGAGLSGSGVVATWKPYVATDRVLLQKRALRTLRPPAGVTLTYDQGVLTATGQASRRWIREAGLLTRTLPGVDRFVCDVRELPRPPDAYDRLQAQARKIEAVDVQFRAGTIELLPDQAQRIQEAATDIRELLRIAATAPSLQVTVELLAFTDNIGNELYNLKLRESRAQAMYHTLSRAGIDVRHLRAVAPLQFEQTRSARAAGFRVVITGERPNGAAEREE